MKLVVDWYVGDADKEVRVRHPGTFGFDMNDAAALAAIQSVVDKYEAAGLTIDQGGDEGHYELGLPDGCDRKEVKALRVKAQALLDDVASALRAIGR